MAIIPHEVYTPPETERITAPLSAFERLEHLNIKLGLWFWFVLLLIGWGMRAVVAMNSQVFAVLVAFGVAGVIWFAFGGQR